MVRRSLFEPIARSLVVITFKSSSLKIENNGDNVKECRCDVAVISGLSTSGAYIIKAAAHIRYTRTNQSPPIAKTRN